MITLSEPSSGNYVIQLEESFDFETHKDFRECINDVVTSKGRELSIDFGNVEYIDSSALGMLMLARHETTQSGCKLALTNVRNNHTKNVLAMVKFDQMFNISYS